MLLKTGAMLSLMLCGCAGGGGAQPGTSTPAPSSSPPSGAAPKLAQFNTYQTQGIIGENDSTLQFKSLTTAGNTIWVGVTLSDYAGVHTISVTDTQGNVYTRLDQKNDPAPGSQSVAHFYAANIAGDTSTPDTITVVWTNENYKGVLAAEISGVTKAPLVAHGGNIQDALGVGTDNVTSGPLAVTSAQAPALLLALSMNTSGGSSDTGGSGYGGPAAGSGLTQVMALWDWGVNLATFATRSVTGAESVTGTFNAPDTDSYVTVAAVFH